MFRSRLMAMLSEIRRRARHIVPQVVLACTLGYFAYHATQGERGLLAWLQLDKELRVAQSEAVVLAGERRQLERRVRLLRPDGLDPDMLEERARALLNYGRDDELIILFYEPQ